MCGIQPVKLEAFLIQIVLVGYFPLQAGFTRGQIFAAEHKRLGDRKEVRLLCKRIFIGMRLAKTGDQQQEKEKQTRHAPNLGVYGYATPWRALINRVLIRERFKPVEGLEQAGAQAEFGQQRVVLTPLMGNLFGGNDLGRAQLRLKMMEFVLDIIGIAPPALYLVDQP